MDPSMDGISPASSHASKPGRSPDDAPSAAAGGAEDKPAKKRKRAAATDKKHICPEPGCGKSFSRPDHLSRHRLNHNPTTTYRCTYTPCAKTFVRLDLLVRHEERHLRKIDPEKAAEHRARTAKAQAQAAAQAQANAQAQSQAGPSGSAQGGSEGGSPYGFAGANLPPLTSGPLPGSLELAGDQQHAYQQRLYGLPPNTGFSPSSFSSGASASGQPFNAFSPDSFGQPGQHQPPLRQNSAPDIYRHQHQQHQFRPDASTSGSVPSGIPPNGTTVNSPDIFQSLSHQPSPHSVQPGQPIPLQPPPVPQHDSFHSFDPTPPPPAAFNQVSALDLVQASYGAPFVSASEYDWLFDPTGGFDISFPASRPASPFGSGAGSMVGSAVGGQNGSAGWMDFGMGYGGGGSANFGGMGGTNGAGGMGNMGISGIGPPGQPSSGALSPNGVRRQLEAFGQQQQEQAQGAGFEPMGDWGTIVEEPEQPPQDDPGTAPEDSASAAGDAQDPSALESGKEHDPEPPVIQPAPPTPVVTEDKGKTPVTNGSTSSKPPGGPEPSPSQAQKDATKLAQSAKASSADSAAPTPATSVRAPFDQNHDPTIFIDNDTRMRVIDYCGPSWQNLRGDTRMTRGAMMDYMELFWTRVHETQAPAVHRASFKASTAPTPLLLSMLLLGCYFSSPEAYKLACNLHAGFRGKVLCSNDFRPRAELWLHQTILLIVIFGKLCSTRMDHEMSHIFWSSCVTLGRRSAIFSQRQPVVFPAGHNDLESQWAAWIEEEVAKRIALIVFGVDVEHAAFFRHSPTLSAFQIQLQLPCDEELWEARDAQEWARLRVNARPPIPFISALKASLMAGHAPPALNPFSRIAILHGLLSVAQDLQWRDHVIGMSQPEGRANNWRDMISASYNSWKSRLDTCLVTATFPTSQLLRASISLYAVAHITLSIDIHELQIYAGAESALGLLVSAAIYNATEARIKIWSSTKDARAACWHAAFFLRSSLQHYQQQSVDLAGCLHHRWSVFLATLTLYAYGRSTSGLPGPRSENYQEAAMRYLDSMCTNSPEGLLTVPGKNNTLDLSQTICEYVESSRWEIAQEGAKILRALQFKSPSAPSH